MKSREEYLSELRDYIDQVETKVTIILQSLQWNRNTLLKPIQTGTCKFDSNHMMPVEKLKQHEEKCFLVSKGYSKEDVFLPEPLDPSAPTVVKLTIENINNIIENAAKSDPLFKRGARIESEPLTLARLQENYTADERCAIHDAVVNMVPTSHDLLDLTLAGDEKGSSEVKKSREQILAELRDTKRRRPRYRGAPQRNYSHELRQVIASQMELYTCAREEPKEDSQADWDQRSSSKSSFEHSNRDANKERRDHYKERTYDRREERQSDGGQRRDRSLGSRHDRYSDRSKRDDHYYHKKYDEYRGDRSKRDGYSSSSRNGKRRHEGDDRKGYRVKKEYEKRSYSEKNLKYEKHRDKYNTNVNK